MEKRLVIVRMPFETSDQEWQVITKALVKELEDEDFCCIMLRDKIAERIEFEYPKNAEDEADFLNKLRAQILS